MALASPFDGDRGRQDVDRAPGQTPRSTPSSTGSDSSSPSASPSASGPREVPAEARAQTQAGAEAFIEFYFDEMNRALTEPTTGIISGLSDPGCQFCEKAETAASYLVRNKQRYTGDPGEVDSLVKVSGEVNVRLVFAAKQTQNTRDVVDENGQVVDSVEEETGDVLIGVSWSGRGWRMYDVEDNTPYESRRPSATRSPK
ncbi:MAG: DUF6318 family protein [Dermatophilaceae bacterium]